MGEAAVSQNEQRAVGMPRSRTLVRRAPASLRQARRADPLGDWLRVGLVLALPFAFVLLGALTYRPDRDGDGGDFRRTLLIVAGLALTLYGAARLRWPLHRPWPLLTMAVVLATGGSFHAVRLVHPIARGAPYSAVAEDFRGPALATARWDATVDAGAQLRHGPDALTLEVPFGAAAALDLLLPEPHSRWLRWPAAWWLPRTFDLRRFGEEVSWSARVQRRGPYLTLFETRDVTLEAVELGLHVSYRVPGGDVEAALVPMPEVGQGAPLGWRLTQRRGDLTLFAAGRPVWTRGGAQPLQRIRFGESRPGPEHAGTIELARVYYARWWER